MDRQKFANPGLILCLAAVSLCSYGSAATPRRNQVVNPKQQAPATLPTSPLQTLGGTKAELLFAWKELLSGDAVVSLWNNGKTSQPVSVEATDLDSYVAGVGQGEGTHFDCRVTELRQVLALYSQTVCA